MILEGFEIENWSCIKKVSVTRLPATGVIVFHGPNRTGKSSIVRALRSCLMDYPSSTTASAVKSCHPRGTGEKPLVSVTFQAGGRTYRITKEFGTSRSKLESKTAEGAWKVETTSCAEAHDRTCGYAGGNDSAKGLHQLLWLTQAEFQLPDAKKFDSNVQAQLRGILGVLQTPLDDRFIDRVKERWNVWYSGQRKVGKQQEIKDGSKLAENLDKLEASRMELQESEGKFKEVEALLRQTGELDLRRLDLERQLGEQNRELRERQEEHRRSQARIIARQQAEKDHTAAEKERNAVLEEQRQRAEVAKRSLDDHTALGPAQNGVESIEQRVKAMEEKQAQERRNLSGRRDRLRELQKRAHCVAAKLRALDDAEKLAVAQECLKRAQAVAQEVAGIEKYLAEHRVPDKRDLEALKANWQQVAQLQADRDAASMNLTLSPEKGAGAVQLALDGGPRRDLRRPPVHEVHPVRRKAELFIGGWGRVELSRGTGKGDLDQIEEQLRQCNEDFANALAPFGIAATDPNALDQLLQRNAERRLKNAELDKQKSELKRLAPKGLEPLQTRVVELQTKLNDVPAIDPADADPLPDERGALDRLAADLQERIALLDGDIDGLEKDAEAADTNLDRAKNELTTAKEELAACNAKAKSSREELERLRSDEQIAERVQDANRALEGARIQLKETELTDDERTIDERLNAAEEAVRALERQDRENAEKYNRNKGRLEESEGLHARRSSVGARVDELTRLTERETLEKDAVDRLYALFEECREKQLGTLMGPIRDRVLNWMRVLDIGNYGEVRFNDAFLPDKLMSRDGTSEFTIQEESTGAQEQIGMLVRLALGSTLASAAEPAVAILDDPLTHCDVGRLNKMRAILRRAAEGDQKLTPPAGPLQIVILTCHPEWFRDERATVIDLESPEVMSRFPD